MILGIVAVRKDREDGNLNSGLYFLAGRPVAVRKDREDGNIDCVAWRGTGEVAVRKDREDGNTFTNDFLPEEHAESRSARTARIEMSRSRRKAARGRPVAVRKDREDGNIEFLNLKSETKLVAVRKDREDGNMFGGSVSRTVMLLSRSARTARIEIDYSLRRVAEYDTVAVRKDREDGNANIGEQAVKNKESRSARTARIEILPAAEGR